MEVDPAKLVAELNHECELLQKDGSAEDELILPFCFVDFGSSTSIKFFDYQLWDSDNDGVDTQEELIEQIRAALAILVMPIASCCAILAREPFTLLPDREEAGTPVSDDQQS